MNKIEHKRGDSLSWEILYAEDDGTPIDLTGLDISVKAVGLSYSQVLFEYTVGNGITVPDPTNGICFVSALDTTGYKYGNYLVDITYTFNSEVISSDTFSLVITKQI